MINFFAFQQDVHSELLAFLVCSDKYILLETFFCLYVLPLSDSAAGV
jgi:hypothetical protein